MKKNLPVFLNIGNFFFNSSEEVVHEARTKRHCSLTIRTILSRDNSRRNNNPRDEALGAEASDRLYFGQYKRRFQEKAHDVF